MHKMPACHIGNKNLNTVKKSNWVNEINIKKLENWHFLQKGICYENFLKFVNIYFCMYIKTFLLISPASLLAALLFCKTQINFYIYSYRPE
jgi:hypothetical protein